MFSYEQIERMIVEIENCVLIVIENCRFTEFLKDGACNGSSLKWDSFFVVIMQCTLLLSPVSGFFFLDILWTKSKMLIEEENSTFVALALVAIGLEQISLMISMIIDYFKLSPMKVFILQTFMLCLTCLSVSCLIEGILFQRGSLEVDNLLVFFLFWLIPAFQVFLCVRTSLAIMHTYHFFIAEPESSDSLDEQKDIKKMEIKE